MDKREFEKWVDGAYRKGIRYFLIVGGESSKINYPGYTVLEASEYIKNKYKDVKIGGITIFTRKDEPDRIILKMKKGMEFFVSQIIFETANMKQVLLHLWRLCKVEHLKFPFLYISIAPAQKIRDIEFMKWLGVEFPSAVISYLTQSERKVEIRSFEIINRILDETFEFMEKERIKLGFNVEHVMYSNLELSEKIVKSIKEKI
jgi:5,10-methylenetetrahydrofolate reductase